MTQDKKRKQMIRALMQKTGRSYQSVLNNLELLQKQEASGTLPTTTRHVEVSEEGEVWAVSKIEKEDEKP
jgi:predicted component of type VI protein secretion system